MLTILLTCLFIVILLTSISDHEYTVVINKNGNWLKITALKDKIYFIIFSLCKEVLRFGEVDNPSEFVKLPTVKHNEPH